MTIFVLVHHHPTERGYDEVCPTATTYLEDAQRLVKELGVGWDYIEIKCSI